jgi:parallel beta-helix repeat protein
MSGATRLRRRISIVVGAATATLLGLAITAPPALAAVTTLFVGGANCSDTGQGTQTQPYCTINKAASVAAAGQTVLVASGTYSETVTVKNSGTAGAPIVFQPAAGATVTVSGGTNGFVLSARQYVTISGFTVTGTSSYGISISGSNNIVVSGNTVTNAGHPVSGQIAAGIRLSNTNSSTVTGNATHHNSDTGIFLTSGSTGNVVSYNQSSFNANGFQRNANGINVISPSNTVVGNVVHDNEDSGLQFYPGGDNNLAVNNVSYNNGDHGIDDLNVTGGRLIGNTIYHNCTSGINVEGTSGNYLVKNNIAVDNAVYPAYNGIACSRRAGNIGIWDSAPSTTTVDHNLVFLTKSGTMYVFGSSFTSLAAMRTATGQEQHGLQADPRFVNAAAGNLQLSAGSPAIDSADSGASGASSIDQLKAARVDDPATANTGAGPRAFDDRGAYEFQAGGAAPLPPTAALTVSPGSGVAPLPVTANASGSSDPQNGPLTYLFSFGDGTNVGPQSAPTATHTYATPGTYTVTVTVTNSANLSATATAPVTVTSGGGGGGGDGPGPATYVSQIATNLSTNPHTSGSITVWRTGGVQAGHLIVVTLELTGTTAAGAVTGTDDTGDTLTVAADVADGSGNRLVVLSGLAATGLAVNQKISVTFPNAATYRLTGDELAGVVVADRPATGAGTSTAFSSGTTATTNSTDELVFGAVGLFGGSAPSWATGLTALTTYSSGTTFLGRAYRTTSATGQFAAAGTGTGSWLAVCVTYR